MERKTRAATGNSKPRVFPTIETIAPKPKKATKTKANTTAKRAPATKASKPVGVTKKAPAKKTAGKPTLKTKAKGVAEKVAGTIEGKPGKKAAGTKKLKGEVGTVKTKAKPAAK